MSEDARAAPPCSAPAHRQFDFWAGEWEVRDPEGAVVGRNRITHLFGGCALREEWEGASGFQGTSLNVHDAARGGWHQTWVDAAGSLLLLDGGLRDGTMVLEGTAPAREAPGQQTRHRISWSLLDGDPDRLRQRWEASADGATWETVFDGRYSRVR
jgi:hypothetical protein